jgi:hypothetical protein
MIVRGRILMIMQSRFRPDGHSTSQISINMEMPPTTFLSISSGNMNMSAGFLGPSSAAPMFLYAAVPSECLQGAESRPHPYVCKSYIKRQRDPG